MSTPLDDIVSPPVDGQSSSLLRHSRRSVTCHTTLNCEVSFDYTTKPTSRDSKMQPLLADKAQTCSCGIQVSLTGIIMT
jgi:hypothetical protein